MTDELHSRLQATLGDAYAVARELGGGGMSRVFVARESALDRDVVVKVLAPDLGAGVNIERFRREIALAATLQHPHIVPLLSAGARDGLLYYTMPLIEGSSLRARLARGGELPISEAIKILREVADALAYAHRHHVVHRDIKPDNILYSEGHAVVTDFGVAKAVAASSESATLTSLGIALGTPAYMAPEQALADPNTDHRADIYALGILAYELITGVTPFGQRSAQQLLAAHANEIPQRPSAHRASVPGSLDALIMRCLEKRPADRPQTADEVLHELEAMATPSGGGMAPLSSATFTAPHDASVRTHSIERSDGAEPRATTRRTWMRVAVGAVLIAGGVVAYSTLRRGDTALDPKRVTVAPFENQTGNPALTPIGVMAADWLTTSLVQTGMLDVVDARTSAEERPGAPAVAIAGVGGMSDLVRVTGAGTVVTGAYYQRGDSLEFQARIVEANTGRVIRSLDPVRTATSDPLRGIEVFRQRLTGALAALFEPRLGAYASDVSQELPAFDAYREFILGVDLYQRADFPGAAARFERAAELDTGFYANKLWQAGAYGNGNLNVRGRDSLYVLLDKRRDQLTKLDQFVLDHRLTSMRGDHNGGLQYALEAAKLWPDRWIYNAAQWAVIVNRPALADSLLREQDPTVGFMRGWEAYWSFRVSALHMLSRDDDALEQARIARRQYPGSPYILEVELVVLASLGRIDEIRSRLQDVLAIKVERRSVRNESPAATLNAVAAVLRAHGRQDDATALAQESEKWIAANPEPAGQRRAQRITAAFLQGRYADARAICDSLLTQNPRGGAAIGCSGVAAARLGDRAAAERASALLAELANPGDLGVNALRRAQIAATLGDKDHAMTLLREAYSRGQRFPGPEHDMHLEGLRDHAPFVEFLRPKG